MRVVVTSLLGLSLFCTVAWAEEAATTPTPATTTPQILQANKPTAPLQQLLKY